MHVCTKWNLLFLFTLGAGIEDNFGASTDDLGLLDLLDLLDILFEL